MQLSPFYWPYYKTDKSFDLVLFTRIVLVNLQKAFATIEQKTVIRKIRY